MRDYTDQVIILNALAAAGVGIANMVSFKAVMLELAQVGFTGTIKFVGSNADAAPDFSSAASASNPWDYVDVIDQNGATVIAGSTGITSTTVTSIRQLEVNSDGMKWIGAIVTRSAGSVTLKAKGYTGI